MRILPANDDSLKEAVQVIKNGGIVAHQTETCYGFACDLTNPAAVQKLFAIKQRPSDQPVSALFASIAEAKKYVEWGAKAEELAWKYLPGPLTIILPLRAPLHEWKTLGVRISSHPVAMRLAELSKVPLSTTSANIHGQANPYSATDIEKQFSGKSLQPDLILDGGKLLEVLPSTVVCVEGQGVRVLRQGSERVSSSR